MNKSVCAVSYSYRRYWLPDVIVLTSLAVVTMVVFWITDLDIITARLFYHPSHSGGKWPLGERSMWWFFYQSAPFVTGSFVILSVTGMVLGSCHRGMKHLRLYCLFVLLSLILGPGLVVNGILKDWWGRPRPRQVVELGGTARHVPPFVIGNLGKEKSFPCGHCSVGYLYCVGWFIWRRRRPKLAIGSLSLAILLGSLLGVGRMAAGGHFLSDVLWSGCIAFAVTLMLYYFVLKIPMREEV